MITLGTLEIAPREDQREADPAAAMSDVAERLQNIFGGRFEVLAPIAIGGMATIYQLKHRLHHGLFVAKVLHPHLTNKPGIITSFRAEAAHAARLGGHPNALPVFDFGELDGLFFMTMPYVEGEDLDKILQRQGSFSKEETLLFAAQLSSLLCFAESEGIVHCDLTPANIRLDSFGMYRLLDFGISQSAAYGGHRGFTGGTPLYLSPEQLRGGAVTVRSDLYALGAIMAEMLAGKPLFQAGTLKEIEDRHLRGDWAMPIPFDKDQELSRLLQKLLATNPDERFESSFELSGALDTMGFPRPEFRAGRVLATDQRKQVATPRRGRLSLE